MNSILARSFANQNGYRGVHFYSEDDCNFVQWDGVIELFKRMDKRNPGHREFEEKLLHIMSNINPDEEFVLCHHHDDLISIECFRLNTL